MDASSVSPIELQRELVSQAGPPRSRPGAWRHGAHHPRRRHRTTGHVRSNDLEMLRDGLVLYDALSLWAREATIVDVPRTHERQ